MPLFWRKSRKISRLPGFKVPVYFGISPKFGYTTHCPIS